MPQKGNAVMRAVLFVAAVQVGHGVAAAQDSIVSLFWENDMDVFRGCGTRVPKIDPQTLQPIEVCEHSDRYYTNGIKLTVSSRYGGRVGLPDFFKFSSRGYLWQKGFSFGQNLYSPANITKTEFQPDDRPFGAWLYVGFHGKAVNVKNQHLLEVQIGCTGECSRGRKVQTFIHGIVDAPTPGGWDYQIANRLGWLVMYERQRRVLDLESVLPALKLPGLDATLRARGMVGNIFTSATAGATIRIGVGLDQDFDPGDGPGTYPAMPGTPVSAPRAYSPEELADAIRNNPQPKITGYLFGILLGTAVRDNVFVEAAPSLVTLEPLVRTLEWGGALSVRLPLDYFAPGRSTRIQFIWRNLWRTGEFKQQPKQHQFGSFHLLIG